MRLNRVVTIAQLIPGWPIGLCSPGTIACPRADDMPPRLPRVPLPCPGLPRMRTDWRDKPGWLPGFRIIDTDINARHRAHTRPCPAANEMLSAWQRLPIERVGNLRADLHARHRLACPVRPVIYVGMRLELPAERIGNHANPLQPLDRSHPIPPRHDQPQGRAMFGGSGAPFIS